ncbi:hypothetical protein LXA43DRAFT_1101049 [Ganoderma leucocontextum]|nr:hypothetical protein LXA43DRAFT_1101049 [Ganoderma leucocontextum]
MSVERGQPTDDDGMPYGGRCCDMPQKKLHIGRETRGRTVRTASDVPNGNPTWQRNLRADAIHQCAKRKQDYLRTAGSRIHDALDEEGIGLADGGRRIIWSASREDMGASERCAEGAVRSGALSLQLTVGTFIWVIPEAMTPGDARAEEQDFVYNCRVYLHGHDIVDSELGHFDGEDEGTANRRASLGGKQEFVRTKTFAYVWETRVEDVVEVAKMDTASLRRSGARRMTWCMSAEVIRATGWFESGD